MVQDQCVPVLLLSRISRGDCCRTAIDGVAGVAAAADATTRLAATQPITAAHLVLSMQASWLFDVDVLSLHQRERAERPGVHAARHRPRSS
jgi:hypothetical protein